MNQLTLVILLSLSPWCVTQASAAARLTLERASAQCGVPTATAVPPPVAQRRLRDSRATPGERNILWAWLGSPTTRYPHAALGSSWHAASLHGLVTDSAGQLQELSYRLPVNRVFEDRLPRLIDLDRDGLDEIVLVQADARLGASLVVFGVRHDGADQSVPGAVLVELARSPAIGLPMRWLNPIGAADFDADGRLDLAAVITPHLSGVLTLYHFRPPYLTPYASTPGWSNHRFGTLEQQLSAIVEQPDRRPAILVPDLQYRSLQALRWEAPEQWETLAAPLPLPAMVTRLMATSGGGCVQLADATWWRVTLASPP